MSSHRLKVETGKWQKPTAFNERQFTLCLKLEDEFHFLLEWPLYEDLRKKYVNEYYWKKHKYVKLYRTYYFRKLNCYTKCINVC